MMQAEFDNYIQNYRGNLDKALAISGESSDFFAQYKAKKLKEWLPEMANKPLSILDFGCGDGVMTNYVSIEFPHADLSGVDPSPKSIQTAQHLFSHIAFKVNSDTTTELDFNDSTFDLIFG
jgi:trans-aconitate methyltransferase